MDMDHSGMDMSMGGMDMGNGVPKLADIQKDLWITIGSVIALFTVANLINYIIYRQR
jgi:hypothetical protein